MRIPRRLDRWISRRRVPAAPETWSVVASLRADGPLVGLPALRRVLVLAPHPDDESIGAGGTLARLAEAGAEVEVVVLTDGERTPGTGLAPDEVGRRRRREATRACAVLGARPPRFLGLADESLPAQVAELAGRLGALVPELAPDALFLPWFGDGHPDHRAVTAAVERAGPVDPLDIWAYETWTPLPANRIVDITPVIDRKRTALAAHETAGAAFDLEAMVGLDRYRSVHGLAGHGWAEAFLVAPVSGYLSLARTHAAVTPAVGV